MHTEHVKLGEDGRVVIPAALRKSVGLRPGDTLVIESDGDSLLVRPLDRVLREVQAFFTDTLPSEDTLAVESPRSRPCRSPGGSRG